MATETKNSLNHDLPDYHDELDLETSNHKNQMNQKNHSADNTQASVHLSKSGN